MEKPVNLDWKKLEEQLKNQQYNVLAEEIKALFSIQRNEKNHPLELAFKEENISFLTKALKTVANCELDDNVNVLLKELFRALRNAVVNKQTQLYLTENDDFLSATKVCIGKLIKNAFGPTLQILLQFLINWLINNEKGAFKLYDAYFDIILELLDKEFCVYETSALLYNISVHKPLTNEKFEFYEKILKLYRKKNEMEYLNFLIEKFFTYTTFWDHYNAFKTEEKVLILEKIRLIQIEQTPMEFSKNIIKVLSKRFCDSGPIIYETVCDNINNLEPYEVAQTLEVLASFCSNENYLEIIKFDKDLLINAGILLINIHRLGKESDNYFSTLQKLSEIRSPKEVLRNHPAFGIKVTLIRIIGNMCWKNKVMQDLVRKAELIPVILDCCNIDARNPFIMQWVILAVRNLCENNLENQGVIANLHQQGVVSSAVLEEFGLTLQDGNNSIKIVPYEALKNGTNGA